MKISELMEKTGVSRETIHFYIREGLLPQPRKTGKNTSDYDESFIETIRTIKRLQENLFLPLSSIKKILKENREHPAMKQFHIELMSEYFRPFNMLYRRNVGSREALMEKTAIGEKWIDQLEEWKIISPKNEDGLQVYSNDDELIARLIVNMDNLGFGPKDGYDPSILAEYPELFSRLIGEGSEIFVNDHFRELSVQDSVEKLAHYSELLALFGYFLFRKMVRERMMAFAEKEFGDEGAVFKD